MSNRTKERLIMAIAGFQLLIMSAALAHSFYTEFAFEKAHGVTIQEIAKGEAWR